MRQLICSRLVVASCLLFGGLIFSACSALPKTPQENRHTLLVTATAFNTLAKPGQGKPDTGAWGDRIIPGMNIIAVSADLVALGLTRGTRVRIDGLRHEFVVLDRMPEKWQKRIDIYMGSDVKAARSWGRREVNIHWTASDTAKP